MRLDGREAAALRPVKMTLGYVVYPEGSVLIEVGQTRVLCNATVEDWVPRWLVGTGRGWVTAEYAMLPRATQSRSPRERTPSRIRGRTEEIQRMIGRSLRAVTDLKGLDGFTVRLDCDVIQADGGTRTACITGAFVALAQALATLKQRGQLSVLPLDDHIGAISVGMMNDDLPEDACDVAHRKPRNLV